MRTTLLKKGRRELWSRKIQYALLVIILGMGIAMFNSLYDFMDSRELTLDTIYDESRFMDLEAQVQYGITFQKEELDMMIAHSSMRDNIEHVEYRLMLKTYVNHSTSSGERQIRSIIYGYDYFTAGGTEREIMVNRPLFFDDDITIFHEANEHYCYLEYGFASFNNIKVGDTLKVLSGTQETELTVIELVNVPDYFIVTTEESFMPMEDSLAVLIVPLELANDLTGKNSSQSYSINDVLFTLNPEVDVSDIKKQVEDFFAEASLPVTVLERDDNPAYNQLTSDIESDKQIIGIFPIIVFIVSGIGLVLALRRMVQIHRPQIGIFKALGVSNRIILSYFFIIGAIIAVLSIIIGYGLMFPLNAAFNGLLKEMLHFAIMRHSSSPSIYVISSILGFVLCILCTLLPAYFAIRVKPVDVIQKREGIKLVKKKKEGFFSFRTNHLPAPLKLVFRDVSRKPVRTITTIFGVALALSLFLSVVILSDSFLLFLERSNKVNTWDYEVTVSGFAPFSLPDQWIDQYRSIETVNPGLRLPLNLSSDGETVEVMWYGLRDLSQSLNLGIEVFGGDGIYISGYIAQKLQVKSGDWVHAEIPKVSETFEFSFVEANIEVLGIHNNPIGIYVYCDLLYMQKLSGLDNLANVFLLHTQGEKLTTVELNRISRTPDISSVTYVHSQEERLSEMFNILLGVVYMMILLSVILATAIVYNLFMISAAERSREFATMRTLGTSLRRISYLIFLEGSITLAGGISFGGVGGYLLGIGMFVNATGFEEFEIPVVFSWNGFVIGSLVLVGVVFIVSLLTIRYIHRISIADVIRDRSAG